MTRWSALPIALLLALPAFAHEALGIVLRKLEREIREHPGDYLERSERAWLMLEHGMTESPVAEDIDTLMAKPAWRETGVRLRAYHLYLQGRHDEAKVQANENLAAGIFGAEQFRLLAGIALAHGDTLGATQAYRNGWKRMGLEEDYISMVKLSRREGSVPAALLEEGLRVYPQSPGVHAVVFRAYLENGDPASVRKALSISDRGHAQLWPRSGDWKIRHAQALLALGKPDSAEVLLLRAMDWIEGETRLRPDADEAVRLRREIFDLLDTVRHARR